MSIEKVADVTARVVARPAGVSRKLLARKAREAASQRPTGAPIESSFPAAPDAKRSLPRATLASVTQQREQTLRVGDIRPNANTVVATIVGLVAEQQVVTRTKLLHLMSQTSFSHPAARPHDRAWCQGYVAGALRSGFLNLVAEASPEVIRPAAASTQDA